MRTPLVRFAVIFVTVVAAQIGLAAGAHAAAPPVPTGLKITASSSTSLTYSWTKSSGATKYRLWYGVNANGTKATKKEVGDVATVTFTGLKANTTYYVDIAAINSSGQMSKYTARVSGKTSVAGAPVTPTGLAVTGSASTSLTYSWTKSSGATKYRLWYGVNANGTKATKKEVGDVATVTFTGLKANTTYYVDIAAINSSGQMSKYTARVSGKTSVAGAPVTPTGLAVTDRTATSLTYSWTKSSGATKYRLWYGTNPNGTGGPTLREVGDVSTVTFTGLTPSTTYYVDIAAVGSAGTWGAYSARVPGTTLAAGTPTIPAAPTGLTVTERTATSLTYGWTKSPGAAGYRIWYGTDPSGDNAVLREVGDVGQVTLTGLTPNTTYHLNLAGFNAAGQWGAYSPKVSGTTLTSGGGGGVADISVATYNVAANQNLTPAWQNRRHLVWDVINERRPDVVSLQEAAQNPYAGSQGGFYFDDVVEGLTDAAGEHAYVLTNRQRYNCTTGSRCRPGNGFAELGASAGTRIAYNSTTMSLVDAGSRGLFSWDVPSEVSTYDSYGEKYLAWAVLEHRATGKRVFVANTHLTTGALTLKERQAQLALDAINELNTGGLPVVFTGDFNIHPYSADNGHTKVIGKVTAAGFRDPLGTQANTWLRASTGLAETFIGQVNCDSMTGFRVRLPLASAPINNEKDCWYNGYDQTQHNGNNIDYIFTRGINRVLQWETAIRVDAQGYQLDRSGNRYTTTPSDHNMLRVTVRLP